MDGREGWPSDGRACTTSLIMMAMMMTMTVTEMQKAVGIAQVQILLQKMSTENA